MSSIQTIQPVKSVLPPLQSASKHVVDRKMMEIYPQSGRVFSYDGQKRIIFDISSPSSFVDFSNSYLRFDLKVSATPTETYVNRYLSETGAQSLIRNITFSTASGTEIYRIDRYNQINAIVSSLTKSNDYIDTHLSREADSVRGMPIPGFSCARNQAVVQGSYSICMQPMSSFLQDDVLFPLAFIRSGIQVSFELDRPYRSVVLAPVPPADATNAPEATIAVSVENPVYVLDMVTPSNDLFELYKDVFMSDGLKYPFMRFTTYNESCTNGVQQKTIQIHSAGRSARTCFLQVQDDRAETLQQGVPVGYDSYSADCIAQGLKAGLAKLQLRSGSDLFPLTGPLNVTNDCSEVHVQNQRALNQLGRINSGARGFPYERQALSYNPVSIDNLYAPWEKSGFQAAVDDPATDLSIIGETLRLYYVVDLSRDSSLLSGLDLSLNNLTIEMTFDTAYVKSTLQTAGLISTTPSDRYITAFVAGDAILSISNKAVNVLY